MFLSLQNTWAPAPHLQQAMEGLQSIPEKMWTFQSRQYSFIFITGTKHEENHLCFLFSTMRGCTWRQHNSQIQMGLCLRAAELFMRTRTPATLLVPETLTWVLGNSSSTHLSCPNSAVTKVKTWLTWQEN